MSSEMKNVSTKLTEKSDEILPGLKEESMASSCSTCVKTNTATSSSNNMSLKKNKTPKIENTPIKIENSISEKNDSSKTKITPIVMPTETTTSVEASIKTEKIVPKEYNDEIIPSVDDEPMPDVCDCLIEDCPGCFFPCPTCTSNKCGLHCRTNRDFKSYDVWIDEGRNEVYSACSEEMRQKHEALIKEEKQKKLKKKKKKHDVLVKMEAMENFLKKKNDDLKRMEHGDDILKTTETKDNVLETVKQKDDVLETVKQKDEVLEIAECSDDSLKTVEQRNDILDQIEQGDIFRTMSKEN